MAFAGIRSGPQPRPLPRFTNDRFPHLRRFKQALLVAITLLSDGVHLFGWNFAFPSRAELLVWRAASLVMFGTAAVFWGAEVFAGLHRDQVGELLRVRIFQPSRLGDLKEARRRRPPRPQPTPESFPLPWEFAASMTMALLYLVARAYVLVKMFAGLRILPASAYTCVYWTNFVPHV